MADCTATILDCNNKGLVGNCKWASCRACAFPDYPSWNRPKVEVLFAQTHGDASGTASPAAPEVLLIRLAGLRELVDCYMEMQGGGAEEV